MLFVVILKQSIGVSIAYFTDNRSVYQRKLQGNFCTLEMIIKHSRSIQIRYESKYFVQWFSSYYHGEHVQG